MISEAMIPIGRSRFGFFLRYFPPGTQHKSFDNFSPRVGVQLYPTDDIMIYGSWSRGYKTGGWTTRLSNPLPTAPDFDEEEAESFEVGVKSTLWDRRLIANLAVFSTDYSGIQLNFQQGVSPTIQNAGDARIKGAELEISLIPNRVFRLDGAIGLIDAEYTDVLPQSQVAPNGLQAGVFPGAELPKTPAFLVEPQSARAAAALGMGRHHLRRLLRLYDAALERHRADLPAPARVDQQRQHQRHRPAEQ